MTRRGSIISQLLIAVSVFAVLIGIAAGVGYAAVGRQNSAAKQLTGRDHVRLQAMVRAAGIPIREPLTAGRVFDEARTVLEQNPDPPTTRVRA